MIFLADKYDFLMEIISNEMRLKRVDSKHGALFKSTDGNVTVTVYKSTNTIHVQGTAYFGWTKSFVEKVKAKAENVSSYNEGDVTCQVPQMTSTPIRREVTPPADESQCHHDCEDDFETMDRLYVRVGRGDSTSKKQNQRSRIKTGDSGLEM